jgi:hypothetical protein
MTAPGAADLDAVRPADLEHYLRGTGWVEQQHADHISVWTTGDGGDDQFELLLPHNDEFRDYRVRLLEAIQTIALAEERELQAVLADVALTVVDTQHFRLLPRLPAGTISLVDVIDSIRGIRDLMYAAAHSAVMDAPLLVQPRPRPPEVNQFIRTVRLAAPKSGSFVLTAQVPLTPKPSAGSQPVLPDGEARQLPFTRRVVLQLRQAMRATHRAAGEALRTDSLEPFADRASDGITANLCEAVSLIGKSQPFELRFAWARSMPTTDATPRLTFDRHLLSIIDNAAKELPRLATEEEVELIARVIKLDRADQSSGRVTMRGALRKPPGQQISDVSFAATLPTDLYNVALEAHRDRRRIRIVGRLRGNELQQIRTLEILDGSQ